MTNIVIVSKDFQRDAKHLLKKFHTLRNSIDELIDNLSANPYRGDPYGNKLYKIRLSDKSKGGGKSGGFRVIYYHFNITIEGIEILLLTIFDKSELSTMTKPEVIDKLNKILGDTNF